MLKRNHAYEVDDIVYVYNNTKLKCITAGTTSSEPFFFEATNDTVIDGTVEWQIEKESSGGSGGAINIEEDFEQPSFTVPDKTYGYVTNVYFKDILTGQYKCESEDIVVTYKTHLCCLYVKYKQGGSSQSSSNNYPSVVSGITLPPNEINSGYLRLTTSGEIWAIGAHSAGSVYDGLALYSYTQTIKTSK